MVENLKINLFLDKDLVSLSESELKFIDQKTIDFSKICFFFKCYSYYLNERIDSLDKLINLLPKESTATYYMVINSFRSYLEKEKELLNNSYYKIKTDILDKYEEKINKINEKIRNNLEDLYKQYNSYKKQEIKYVKAQNDFMQKSDKTCTLYQTYLEIKENIKSSSSQKEKYEKKANAVKEELKAKLISYKSAKQDIDITRDEFIKKKKSNNKDYKTLCKEIIEEIYNIFMLCLNDHSSNYLTLCDHLKNLQNSIHINSEKDSTFFDEQYKLIDDGEPKKLEYTLFSKKIEFADNIKNNKNINKEEIENKLKAYIDEINNSLKS